MALSQTRKQSIQKRIVELEELLLNWEEKRDISENPNEQKRCELEIGKIKKYLNDYTAELQGGTEVVEDKNNPVKAPDVREINKRWIIGIIVSIFLLIGVNFIYTEVTAVTPDYEAYLAYVAQGDSLIVAKKYDPAEKAYSKALEYNPKDSAVIKKLDYLHEAKKLIEEKKFGEATETFEIILKIPASMDLTLAATNRLQRKIPEIENSSLILSISMQDGNLIIKVTGGMPFENSNQPYLLKGIDCTDCINWSKGNNEYIATITGNNIGKISITVEDQMGNSKSSEFQPNSENNIPIEENKPEMEADKTNLPSAEELYEKTKIEADDLFKKEEYAKAKKAYAECLEYKSTDPYCLEKIKECTDLIRKKEIIALKNIPKINVAGSKFIMGSEQGFSNEKPEKNISIKNFKIGTTEVTVKQFKSFCKITGHAMPDAPPWGWIDSHPIVNVNWQDAMAFCKWVGGRLPTEAEWEYAAKGGTASKNYKYSGGNSVNKIAWYKENTKRTKAIKSKKPNELSIYDMTGNVAEWCADWYGRNYYKVGSDNNPKGPTTGTKRTFERWGI